MRNRPEVLNEITNYKKLPEGPLVIDYDALPELARLDAFLLEGIKPTTKTSSIIAGVPIKVNPKASEINYYRNHNVKFQIVYLVINAYNFRRDGDVHVGRPYSMYVSPFPKRGAPEIVDIDFVASSNLRDPPFADYVFCGFDPFSPREPT